MQCKPDDLLGMDPQESRSGVHCACRLRLCSSLFKAPQAGPAGLHCHCCFCPVLSKQTALRCAPELAEQHSVLCRFKMCSLVTARPSMRFYAGMALTTQEGEPLGAL